MCSVGINLFRQLAVYLAPVLPTLAAQVQDFLKLASFDFASRTEILTGHEIALFQPLMQRVDPKAVAAMVDASKDSLAAPAAAPAKAEKKKRKPKRRKLNLKLVKLRSSRLMTSLKLIYVWLKFWTLQRLKVLTNYCN